MDWSFFLLLVFLPCVVVWALAYTANFMTGHGLITWDTLPAQLAATLIPPAFLLGMALGMRTYDAFRLSMLIGGSAVLVTILMVRRRGEQ